MSFDPARPRYVLPFAGKDYELLGTMELIEAVEFALKRGILQIAVDVVEAMPTGELAVLLSTILTARGKPLTVAEAKGLLWGSVGLAGDDNRLLRLHLYSFLSICLAPPGKREAKAKTVGEILGELTKASPGSNTSGSASAS
jgi:hypothetical protein